MLKRICLQAGHWNTTTGATGAPGEQELNKRIMLRLKDILISKGFQLFLVDANPPDSQLNEDFDLFLALHGDADIYGTGGGFVDFADPSIDSVHTESKRIKEAIEDEYFNHSGIINHPERSNANTRFYYMWSRLTLKTPCVIIEMGVVQDAHDKVILADTDRVSNAIARGICKAFNVPFEQVEIPTALEQCLLNYKNLEKEFIEYKITHPDVVKSEQPIVSESNQPSIVPAEPLNSDSASNQPKVDIKKGLIQVIINYLKKYLL